MVRHAASFVLVSMLLIVLAPVSQAWEHHPLFTEQVAATMPEVTGAAPAAAVSLEAFLTANEAGLAALLAEEEQWARTQLSTYMPCPDALAFVATGNAADIRDRFFKAIRVNPNTETPLYVSYLNGLAPEGSVLLPVTDVTILSEPGMMTAFDFAQIAAGELVAPIDILRTASNEPDYGMDVGLFTDNGTEFGQYYGFGVQPFGNPNLDYGSQAPFHMGFLHQSPIIYLFASFLKQSYIEYRIHLYKSLSEFAFANGQDYWGWRFMGWGVHLMGDMSMPYHMSVLPGYSTFRMLIINLLDLLGISVFKDNAVQLVSNRHMAIEIFEGITLAEACRDNDLDDPVIAALRQSREVPAYTDSIARDALAKASYRLAVTLDKIIAAYMPEEFVCDPKIELADVPERYNLVEMIEAEHGDSAIAKIKAAEAQALSLFATYGRSYILGILGAQ